MVLIKDGKIKRVEKKYHYDDGDEVLAEIEPIGLYAMVYRGMPYVCTDYGYYPLEKKGDDFFFTGKELIHESDDKPMPLTRIVTGSSFSNTDIIISGRSILNAVDDLAITSLVGISKGFFEMQIDYLTGKHIKLKQVEEKK